VDFAATATDPTPVHFTAGNQSYVGGNAPNKVSGSFNYAETGTGAWGSRIYVGSWCVADIIQYQKAKPADPVTLTTAQYSYNVSIWDSDTPPKWIGGTAAPIFSQEGVAVGIDSLLPQVLDITSAGKPFPLVRAHTIVSLSIVQVKISNRTRSVIIIHTCQFPPSKSSMRMIQPIIVVWRLLFRMVDMGNGGAMTVVKVG